MKRRCIFELDLGTNHFRLRVRNSVQACAAETWLKGYGIKAEFKYREFWYQAEFEDLPPQVFQKLKERSAKGF